MIYMHPTNDSEPLGMDGGWLPSNGTIFESIFACHRGF